MWTGFCVSPQKDILNEIDNVPLKPERYIGRKGISLLSKVFSLNSACPLSSACLYNSNVVCQVFPQKSDISLKNITPIFISVFKFVTLKENIRENSKWQQKMSFEFNNKAQVTKVKVNKFNRLKPKNIWINGCNKQSDCAVYGMGGNSYRPCV